jgi:hypothetical protein
MPQKAGMNTSAGFRSAQPSLPDSPTVSTSIRYYESRFSVCRVRLRTSPLPQRCGTHRAPDESRFLASTQGSTALVLLKELYHL